MKRDAEVDLGELDDRVDTPTVGATIGHCEQDYECTVVELRANQEGASATPTATGGPEVVQGAGPSGRAPEL